MEEHISSIRNAHQRYKDAWATVLAEFSADIGQYNNDLTMDLAIQSLHSHIERFIMTCKEMRADMESPSTISAHIDTTIDFLRYNHQNYQNYMTEVLTQFNIPGDGLQNNNLNNKLEWFILAFEYFRVFILMEVRDPEVEVEVVPNTNEVDPNATEAAPVNPDNAQLRDHLEVSSKNQGDVESDTQHVNEANMSEKHEETVENHKEHEETEEHHPAALPILPDPDTNNDA